MRTVFPPARLVTDTIIRSLPSLMEYVDALGYMILTSAMSLRQTITSSLPIPTGRFSSSCRSSMVPSYLALMVWL